MGYVTMEDESYSNEMEKGMERYKSEWDKKKSKILSVPIFQKSKTVVFSPYSKIN